MHLSLNPETSLQYQDVEAKIKEVYKLHSDLEEQVDSLRVPLKRFYTRLKHLVFGKTETNPKQTLSLQYATTRQLHHLLDRDTEKAHDCLDKLVSFIDQREEELEESLEQRNHYQGLLLAYQEQAKSYKQKKTFLETKEARAFLRNVSEAKHNYTLALEKALDLRREQDYLHAKEEYLRNNVQLSQRLSEKVKRFLEQLSILKESYDVLFRQNKVYVALVHYLGAQKTQFAHFDSLLGEFQKAQTGFLAAPHVNGYSTDSIKESLDETNLLQDDRLKDLEDLLKEYKL